MTWQNEVDELRRREGMAREMGGPEKVDRQHQAGRLTIRERFDQLLDPDSFHEIGGLAGFGEYEPTGELRQVTPTNLLFGRGRIDGRTVVISGDDFTVRGGAADASIHEKLVAAEQMAHEYRLPIVRLIEGTGGGGSVKSIASSGYTYPPAFAGLGSHGHQPGHRPRRDVRPRAGRRARRRSDGGQPLLGDDQGSVADVRGGSAGGRRRGRDPDQGRAGWEPYPHQERGGRRGGRDRVPGASGPAGGSSPTCRRRSTPCRLGPNPPTIPTAATPG